jgi:hypothetical protein
MSCGMKRILKILAIWSYLSLIFFAIYGVIGPLKEYLANHPKEVALYGAYGMFCFIYALVYTLVYWEEK